MRVDRDRRAICGASPRVTGALNLNPATCEDRPDAVGSPVAATPGRGRGGGGRARGRRARVASCPGPPEAGTRRVLTSAGTRNSPPSAATSSTCAVLASRVRRQLGGRLQADPPASASGGRHSTSRPRPRSNVRRPPGSTQCHLELADRPPSSEQPHRGSAGAGLDLRIRDRRGGLSCSTVPMRTS